MQKPPRNAPAGFDWVRCMRNCRCDKNELTVMLDTTGKKIAKLRIQAVSDNIWHYTFIPPNVNPCYQKNIVENSYKPPTFFKIIEAKDYFTVSTPGLRLRLQKRPFEMQFLDKNGRLLCNENTADVNGLGQLFILPLGYVRAEEDVTKVTQTFHLNPDEHLFGLGEKFTRLDKTGQRVVTWTQDALGSTSERSHKNIPFMWSTKGFGLFVNTTSRITWDLGTTSTQSFTIEIDSNLLDIFVIYGPEPKNILRRYSDLTGYAVLPPKWSFGLWISSCGTYRDQKSMENLIDGLDEHHIPADVVHIDPWWMRWRKYSDYQWNREAFPLIEQFIDQLHKKDLKLSLWDHPYISVESDLFEYGKACDYFIKDRRGNVYVIDYGLSLAPRPDGVLRQSDPAESWNASVVIIDLTNPAAYAWFKDLHRPVLKVGADVFKTDFGEDIPEDAVFFNGETGKTVHNMYPLLYNQAVYEVTRKEKGYGMVWSRSAFAGSQKYPLCWSADPAADWDSLAATIRGGLSIGLSGIPFWSNDIGGYRGMPSPELYVRWAQFGLFCSHSRMHGDSPREPWYFGDRMLNIVKSYIELRYQLFPYLYSTAQEAVRSGLPVIRAMPLMFPEDPNCHGKDHQFMLGKWLLIAPVFNETGERYIYFPKGRWLEYSTGRIHQGPAVKKIKAPLEILPLYMREGSILPMMKKSLRIPESIINPLIVDIFPASESSDTFYEDHGQTVFTCHKLKSGIQFKIKSSIQRSFILRFRKVKSFKEIRLESEGKFLAVESCHITYERAYLEVRLSRIMDGTAIIEM